MKPSYWLAAVGALVLCSGFSSDSAGKACVKAKGERGVGYDVDRTKVTDAYGPGGRRMLQDGHRVYEIEVPALIKRDKAVHCTMSLATGLWEAPGFDAVARNPLAPGNTPSTVPEKRSPDQR